MVVVLNLVMMMVTQMHLLYPDAAAPPALHLAIHPSGFWLLVAAQNLLYFFQNVHHLFGCRKENNNNYK